MHLWEMVITDLRNAVSPSATQVRRRSQTSGILVPSAGTAPWLSPWSFERRNGCSSLRRAARLKIFTHSIPTRNKTRRQRYHSANHLVREPNGPAQRTLGMSFRVTVRTSNNWPAAVSLRLHCTSYYRRVVRTRTSIKVLINLSIINKQLFD